MYNTETIQVANYVYNTFMEIVHKLREDKVFPKEFNFSVNKTSEINYRIYIDGNKVAGNDYEKNTWKDVPIVDCSVHYYTRNHPTMPGEEYVNLNVHYSGGWCSDYGQIEYVKNGCIKKHLQEAIETAIKDFTIQHTI